MPSANAYTPEALEDIVKTLENWAESPPNSLDITENRRIQVARNALDLINALTTRVKDAQAETAEVRLKLRQAQADLSVRSSLLHSIRALAGVTLPDD